MGEGEEGGCRPVEELGSTKPVHAINYTNTRAATLEVSRA